MKAVEDYKLEVCKRLSVCESCEHFLKRFRRCSRCGCFMEVKARIPYFDCPEKKWPEWKKDQNQVIKKIPRS